MYVYILINTIDDMIYAFEQFISQYINEMNKTCKVCQNIKPFKGSIKLHVSRKHSGRAAKEFAPTF